MDYLYEQTAPETVDAVKVTQHDDKTDQAFQKFEEHVDEQIQKTSKAIMGFVKEQEQLNLHIPEDLKSSMTNKAQEVLGKLDGNLEKVEQLTQGYWNTVSNKSFWSSMASTISTQFQEALDLDGNNIAEDTKDGISGTITDTRLKQLSIDKSLYLNYDVKNLSQDFVVEEHLKEIRELLENDSDLKGLHDFLVPNSFPDKIFWGIYYARRKQILELASKKRELLKVKKDHEKEQQLGWDEEEEDSTEEIIPSSNTKSSHIPAASESSKHASKEDSTAQSKHTTKDDGEDDDDDWE